MRFSLAILLAGLTLVAAQSSDSAASSASASASSSASGASAAASTTAVAALSPCALSCISLAAADTACGTPTNVTCVCTDADFQFKAGSCLSTECQPAEMGAALGLQNSQCGAASLSATAKPTATAPFTPSNSNSDISASSVKFTAAPGASSAAPGGALALSTPKGIWLAAGIALVGGFVGGVLV
ncbi:hypothetical protein C8R43DRAFT_940330 [Mycena crocata]|nr:hypothetical protein C8R43DRAFT_940330 [Mycena crocata]